MGSFFAWIKSDKKTTLPQESHHCLCCRTKCNLVSNCMTAPLLLHLQEKIEHYYISTLSSNMYYSEAQHDCLKYWLTNAQCPHINIQQRWTYTTSDTHFHHSLNTKWILLTPILPTFSPFLTVVLFISHNKVTPDLHSSIGQSPELVLVFSCKVCVLAQWTRPWLVPVTDKHTEKTQAWQANEDSIWGKSSSMRAPELWRWSFKANLQYSIKLLTNLTHYMCDKTLFVPDSSVSQVNVHLSHRPLVMTNTNSLDWHHVTSSCSGSQTTLWSLSYICLTSLCK